MTRQPKIDEMITFLELRKVDALPKIRETHPDYASILKQGEICGPSSDIEELKIRAEVCSEALDETVKACTERIQQIKKRLLKTQQTQLWGQLAAAIGGAAVITTLAAKFTSLAFVGGGLSLVGSLIPIVVQRQNKSLDKSKGLDEIYPTLVKFRSEAEYNKKELAFFINHQFNTEGISQVINDSNKLCKDIMELLDLS